MENISVSHKEKIGTGWRFRVEVDGINYSVEVDEDYWQKLTDGKIEPDELVRKSFEFLLEREPKESILKRFNLHVISTYFPEYENTI